MSEEFQYRLPGRVGGWRPGAHASKRLGTGQEFAAHRDLFDWPDPRRLDVRASLRSPQQKWLVRIHQQRSGIDVHAVVDVSASMAFGARHGKLDVVADFLEALGQSTFRAGDALGLLAFDAQARDELLLPARRGRGVGRHMGELLRQWRSGAPGWAGVHAALEPLAGREGLVFLVSDFHWPLDDLAAALETLAHAHVVPIVVWDPAETAAPARNGPAQLFDLETGGVRTLWVGAELRARWAQAVEQRRAALEHTCGRFGLRPFHVSGSFRGEDLSHYFLESSA